MSTASPLAPPVPTDPRHPLAWTHLHGASRGLAIARAASHHDGPLVVVTSDARRAQHIELEVRFFTPDQRATPIWLFPDWECLPYDVFSPHQDICSQRLRILSLTPELKRGIIIVVASNLMQRLPPKDYVFAHSFVLRTGDSLDIDGLRQRLQQAAYQAVSQVMAPGEFAVRGGLVDIYPMGSTHPFRVDLFDDEIESIRYFDPETQRSEKTEDAINLLPAREFPMTPEGIKQFRQSFRNRFEGDPQKRSVYSDVSNGLTPAGVEFYFPLFFQETATFFDYVPSAALWLFYDDAIQTCHSFGKEVRDRFEIARLDPDRPALAPDELFLKPQELVSGIDVTKRIFIQPAARETDKETVGFACGAPPQFPVDPRSDSPYGPLLEHLHEFDGRILLVAETAGRREILQGVLAEHELFPTFCSSWSEFLGNDGLNLGITVAELHQGLGLNEPAIGVITESQLYGDKVFQRRRRSGRTRDAESVIHSLAELKVGDPVVHEEHGVGRYLGLQVLGIDGKQTEFLALGYEGGDKLYIPVLSLHLINRYMGGSADNAPLHKLGSDIWGRAKKRAREKAYDVAAELLEIEALRRARHGYALPEPDESYAAFTANFPFEETPDQIQVIDEVIKDMTSENAMDRLVCGDVGFGKTEIALRASFLAVKGGKQVALLVPTTLLAQQHFQSFSDRFAGMDVRVELLSRFRTNKEIQAVLADFRQGTSDVVIGTHRLLQNDVDFKQLGLLILDEEHRFGVRQKERIKRLRSEVDVLTLTATPIPRTLNMAMAGLRAISIIATPPPERLSIKTFVREWSNGLVREACLREIRRGGQVYFLHNDVRSIERIATDLHNLVPEATVQVAHGQLRERELERIMRDFYHQKHNILVCTTIIESGIDIPSANTIIINRADRFGLAQLHQLRGRVGRSRHQAYAYLIIPDKRSLSADATKRLEAIEALVDLGVGFTLASHDLEIRGAGELLGETQSGLIDTVGFSLYSDYLSRAVANLRQSKDRPNADEPPVIAAEVDLHIPTLFPETYLPDVHTRLIMYKRIANAVSKNELDELRVEMTDRFGLVPEPGKNLFLLTELKLLATSLDILRIDIGPTGGKISFKPKPKIDPIVIIRLMEENPGMYRMEDATTMRADTECPESEDRIDLVRMTLEHLGADAC